MQKICKSFARTKISLFSSLFCVSLLLHNTIFDPCLFPGRVALVFAAPSPLLACFPGSSTARPRASERCWIGRRRQYTVAQGVMYIRTPKISYSLRFFAKFTNRGVYNPQGSDFCETPQKKVFVKKRLHM